MYIYSAIKLSGEDFKPYHSVIDEEPLGELSELSKVNIFIGQNNAGKSRFMRELCKVKAYDFASNIDYEPLIRFLEKLESSVKAHVQHFDNTNAWSITLTNGYTIKKSSFLYNFDGFVNNESFGLLITQLTELFSKVLDPHSSGQRGNIFHYNDTQQFVNALIPIKEEFENIKKNYSMAACEFDKYYLPIYRSLHEFRQSYQGEANQTDAFKGKIKQYHEIPDEINIFTGQNFYDDVTKMLLGDKFQRAKIRNFENFLAKEILNQKEVTLIPNIDDEVIYVNDEPIYKLGDGIQQLIMMTFVLFEVEAGLFFIEEPEQNLHPGMQRKLLEVMLNSDYLKNYNHQYFITTHSNHLLDSTLDFNDISIYSFRKRANERKFDVTIESSGDRSTLELIGVQNSSVFLANSTIWVEGVTDRLYIKKFLELFAATQETKIQDGIDYTFVEYGGNNITHWSFLDEYTPEETIDVDRLCAKSFVVLDSDGGKAKERKEALEKKLGAERMQELKSREIENLLSLATIENTLKKLWKIEQIERPEELSKKDGAPLESRHKSKPLGTFIDENYLPLNLNLNGKSRTSFATESGTIKQKTKFCKTSIEGIKLENLTSEALELAEKIFNFILANKN